MDQFHYILTILLSFSIISILAYREELKEKEKDLKFKEEQIEDLRRILRTYIKEGNK